MKGIRTSALFLPVCLTGSVQAAMFHVEVSPRSIDLGNVTYLFGSPSGGVGHYLFDSAPAGSSTESFFDETQGDGRYAIIATHGSQSENVAISLNGDSMPGVLGQEWSTIFPDYSEAEVAQAVASHDLSYLSGFAQNTWNRTILVGEADVALWSTVGTRTPIVNFSGGVGNGSALVEAVPEPSSMVGLGLAVLALCRRRR